MIGYNRSILMGFIDKITETDKMFFFKIRCEFLYKNKYCADYIDCCLSKEYFIKNKKKGLKFLFKEGNCVNVEGTLQQYKRKNGINSMIVKITMFQFIYSKEDSAFFNSQKHIKENSRDENLTDEI